MVSLVNRPQVPPSIMAPKPSITLKRKHSDLDRDEAVLSPTHTKRLRVAFDPEVEVRIMQDWNDKGMDLVRDEVRKALDRHASGDSDGYDQLKQLFSSRPSAEDAPSSALLAKYVMALMGHVSALGKSCSALVHSVLETRWVIRDEAFVYHYTKFMGSLMSAHGGYIGLILLNIVKNFIQPPSTASRHHDDARCGRAEMLDRTHQCLKYLVRLIPSASSVLKNTLSTSFPHTSDTMRAHVDYVKNILRITEYAPELRGTILALITERVIKIDVHIQTEMEELEEDVEEELLNGVLKERNGLEQDEDDSVLSESSDSESDSEDEDLEEKRVQELKETINKMDSVIDILFDFYQPVFSKASDSAAEDPFEHLLGQFANTILPTYRSRHTQFLLFHYSQSSPSLIHRFTGACAHIAFDKSRPQIIRLAASAYLGSFIARGAHVDRSVVQDVFLLLCDQLESMRLSHEPGCTGPDLRRYGAYYSVAQALLYIFCFRWRDLIDEEVDDDDIRSGGQDFEWLPGIKETLYKNFYSKLNPLKICDQGIVFQFARIANHLHFLYIFSKLETNKRVRLSRSVASVARYGGLPERQSALSLQTEETAFQLDAYFPFDPYRLPKSKRWLEGDYNEWSNIPGLEFAGQDEEDDDTDAGEDESDIEEELLDDLTDSEDD